VIRAAPISNAVDVMAQQDPDFYPGANRFILQNQWFLMVT
jgi:hypothetical protein